MPHYIALPTDIVRAYQSGAPDAFGLPSEHSVSNGHGNPCRHCLRDIPAAAKMLILAYKPFASMQPYAEVGPIFLCADACTRGGGREIPDILNTSPDYLIKGYSDADRIVYGTGAVVARAKITAHVAAIFSDPAVSYAHIRSARNNCYQLRVERDD